MDMCYLQNSVVSVQVKVGQIFDLDMMSFQIGNSIICNFVLVITNM